MRNNSIFPEESALPDAMNVINGTLLVKTLPPLERLHELARSITSRFARLSAVACDDGEWERITPEALDLAYHVHVEEAVDGHAGLAEAIDRIGCAALDTSRPLWRFHGIPCNDPEGYAGIVVRIHHCIGDGVHLSHILMHLTVKADGSHVDTNAARQKFEAMLNGGSCLSRTCRSFGKACSSGPAFISNTAAAIKPLEANSVWQRSAEDRRAGRWNSKRCVVMVPPHSLAFVKQCKDKAKVTVNDVLMGATAGAIRRYCESRDDPLFTSGLRSKAKFRALVPVALPKQFPPGHDEADMLTNHWCFCSAKLPVREATALDRVQATSREMGKLKRSAKPFVGLWMIDKVVPHLPDKQQRKTGRDLFANHSLVFSNVAGPQEPLYIGGERLEGCQLVYYNAIPQIIVTTIAGKVWMNITVDPDVVSDRERFSKCYFEELEELGQSLGVTESLLDNQACA